MCVGNGKEKEVEKWRGKKDGEAEGKIVLGFGKSVCVCVASLVVEGGGCFFGGGGKGERKGVRTEGRVWGQWMFYLRRVT